MLDGWLAGEHTHGSVLVSLGEPAAVPEGVPSAVAAVAAAAVASSSAAAAAEAGATTTATLVASSSTNLGATAAEAAKTGSIGSNQQH